MPHYFYKLKKFILFIFFLILITSNSNPTQAKGPQLSGSMRAFQLATSTADRPSPSDGAYWTDDTDRPVSLANFKGKVVLVNYWATWCSPCIQELPSISRTQEILGGDDFIVVAISLDRGGKPIAKRLFKRLNIKNLALFVDPTNVSAKKLGVQVMPTTFLFDHKGRELGKLVGSTEWDNKEAVALIEYFIKNPAHADTLPVK